FQAPDPNNPTPLATSAAISTNEDTSVIITLVATDTQPGHLKYQVTSLPAFGQLYQVTASNTKGALITNAPALVANSGGQVMYLPPQDRFGNALSTFSFKASDGNTISSSAAIAINVTPTNDAPIAVSDERQVRPGDILSPLREVQNDIDVDSDAFTITSFTQPAVGNVVRNNDGSLRYESSSMANSGAYSFNYTIADPAGLSSTGTVTITYVTSATGSWSTFGNGPEHTGYSPAMLSGLSYTPRWTYTTSAGSRQVATGEGKVFVTSNVSSLPMLTALNERTGAVLWSKNVATTSGYAVNSINSPTYYAGKVYLQNGQQTDARITCVSAADGSIVWSSSVGCQWEKYLAPAVNAQGIFINGGSYGGMYGFGFNGTQLFFKNLEQYDHWTPSLYQSGLYSFVKGVFTRHNATTGAALWSFDLGWSGYSMYRTVAFADGRAFLTNNSVSYSSTSPATLTCIDLTNHIPAWSVVGSFTGTPAISNGEVYAVLTSAPRAEARNASDGSLIRTYSLPLMNTPTGHVAPVVTDDLLIIPNSVDTRIFGRYSGNLLQTINLAGEVAVSDDAIIISATDRVTAFTAPTALLFSPVSGIFATEISVTLTAADASAILYYTTDGTAPTLASSSVASGGSVLMDHTGKLRAISVKGSTISRVFEASYTIGSAPLAAMSMVESKPVLMTNTVTDFDHDGQSDVAEAVADTDPLSPTDTFRVKSCVLTNSGSTLQIVWPSKATRSYRVQCTMDMQNWTDISPSLNGTGATMSYGVPRPVGNLCFLRVRIE
ncbi:MAG: Ig-like domain-containing protein, partial [Verrucomicrobia bacterium]|nr:Ig-like domain-containing protein [Verrucomicrobiota bacterium]